MLNGAIFLLLCLIWGSTWLAIKIGLEGSPPFLGAGFRFAIASAFLIILTAIFRPKGFAFGAKWRYVIAAAMLIYPLPYGLVYWGSQHVETGMAAVLFAVMPFFVAILAHCFVPGDRLTLLKVFGMMIGFTGIILIFADNLGAEETLGVFGMAAVVTSSFFSASGTIISKRHFDELNPFALTAVQSFLGAVILIILGLVTESLADYETDVSTIGSLIYLGIFGTAITFSLYFLLLKKMEATKISMIAFITPVVAMFLGMAYRQERFDIMSLAGSALVILGVFIVEAGDNIIRGKKAAVTDQPAI
jgi:drug/metabolite transporter (DMT)-like permease